MCDHWKMVKPINVSPATWTRERTMGIAAAFSRSITIEGLHTRSQNYPMPKILTIGIHSIGKQKVC